MSRLPCKNIDVMSSICNLTKRFCINCAGYEARSNIVNEPIKMDIKTSVAGDYEGKGFKNTINKGKK